MPYTHHFLLLASLTISQGSSSGPVQKDEVCNHTIDYRDKWPLSYERGVLYTYATPAEQSHFLKRKCTVSKVCLYKKIYSFHHLAMPSNTESSMNPMNEFVQRSAVHTHSAIALTVKRKTLQFQHLFACCLPLSVCKNILPTPNAVIVYCLVSSKFIIFMMLQHRGCKESFYATLKRQQKQKKTMEDLV